MTARPWARMAVSATAVLTLSVLAACDEDADTATPAAGETTSATPSGSTESATPTDAASTDDVAASGAVSKEQIEDLFTAAIAAMTTADFSMTMSTSATGSMDVEGQIDMTSSPADMSMTMDLSSMNLGDVEALMVDGTMYMNLGEMSQGKYIKMTAEDLGASGLDLTEQMDPTKSLEQFVQAFKSGKFIGSDADGDHYRIVVDTSQLSDDVTSGLGSVPNSMTMDMWFADDLFSKAVMDMGSLGSMEMTYSNWGGPVDITAPKASEITTVPGM